MATTDSKALLEVWEMKEKAYESLKHLSSSERVAAILERTKAVTERLREAKAAKPTEA